jgi:undecaprenyl-phosphate 4-deoxy-4-formamido-L-arabinose transferase
MNIKVNLISIIIPTYKGSKTLNKLVEELMVTFINFKIEIVLINDFSPDDTHEQCVSLLERYSDKITYIKFSKNFGEHSAVMAGLKYSEGDLIIIMDDDYQNPPSEAFNLLEYSLKNNYDVVYTKYSIKKDSWFRNLISKIANVSAELLLKKPSSIYFSSFKLIKRNIVNEIIKYTGPFPFIDGLILSITQNIGSFEVRHDTRIDGKSGYNFYKLIKHYGNLTINFSTIPIHLFSILGLIITVLSIFFIISIVIEKIINPSIPQGYSTILTVVFFFAGVQLLFLGLIGEYVGKILKNVNKENQYHINFLKKKGR